ncbi:6495_t:CDS:2 [Cetraspora pellucida]|uniref:6495_t:CDS:1 n=1 Tax=Cetraspora pellucida TaxID=1433469 RepID=A0ACA9KEY4_9GLOM|nr:6495_t:CDS:2 [Cetraspora pellucida]
MTDYTLSSPTTPRVRRSTTRNYRDYTSFDEAEESDYDKRHNNNNGSIINGPVNTRWRANSINSTYTPSFTQGRRFDIKESDSNNNNSRRRRGRNWETDDELFKSSHRKSLPPQLPSPISPLYSPHNTIDESTTTRSLLNLLNSERTKRRELQKEYDSNAEALRELQQKHDDDIADMECDIQVLRDALLKESKANTQLSKLLRETRGKFLEDMKSWEKSWNLKVSEMEAQGKELQKAFDDAWNHLEKEEREVIRLREENNSLRKQLNNRSIDPPVINRLNLEDVRKVGYLEDRDDLSVCTDSKLPTESNEISDTESVANYSKISELTDRISELENELIKLKECNQKYEFLLRDKDAEKHSALKQLEEKYEKKIKLLHASNTINQSTIEKLSQELRKAKFSERERDPLSKLQQKQLYPFRPHTPVKQSSSEQDDSRVQQNKRKILAGISNKERKNSLTSTNSGSFASTSNRSGCVEEKDEIPNANNEYVEGELESEEEDDHDDRSSSLCTSSEVCAQSRLGSEEATSVTDPHTECHDQSDSSSLLRQQQHNRVKNNESAEDDILDMFLSEIEDYRLPPRGHFSAAEFTDDDDYTLDKFDDVSVSRRHSITSKSGMGTEGSVVSKLSQFSNISKGQISDDDGIL